MNILHKPTYAALLGILFVFNASYSAMPTQISTGHISGTTEIKKKPLFEKTRTFARTLAKKRFPRIVIPVVATIGMVAAGYLLYKRGMTQLTKKDIGNLPTQAPVKTEEPKTVVGEKGRLLEIALRNKQALETRLDDVIEKGFPTSKLYVENQINKLEELIKKIKNANDDASLLGAKVELKIFLDNK